MVTEFGVSQSSDKCAVVGATRRNKQQCQLLPLPVLFFDLENFNC